MLSWIVAIVAGAVCGALMGAVLLGLPAAFYNGPSALTSSTNWGIYLAVIGAVCGVVPGVAIGLFVRLANVGKPGGAMLGALVGLMLASVFLLRNFGQEKPIDYRVVVSLLMIPCGAVIGLFLAWLLKLPFLSSR